MYNQNEFPLNFDVDYPEKLDRFTTFFRIIIAIPILIILGLISGPEAGHRINDNVKFIYNAGGLIFAATLLMILFRQKYPRWWFDWNIAFTKFSLRVFTYLLLLRSEYPSTDEEQSVHLEIPYPDVPKDLSRWLPLVKWLLALPHYIVLTFLYIAAFFCVLMSWFAIVFAGKYPKGFFDFVVGVIRWSLRVDAYAFLLTTDKYPLFSLK